MSVVAFGSVRSCGVTTLALALAATWPPERRVLLVEADPAGGSLAAASRWPAEPNLVSLAAAARRGGDPSLAWEHSQELPGGAAVLGGPASAEQARSVLGMLAGLLGRLGDLDADVLVDCGRLDPGSPAQVLWERADRVVLAARPLLADLHALAAWLEASPVEGSRLGLVTIGDGPYPDEEITEALGVGVLARLPWDPGAAEALVSVPASARELRLAPLVRAARTLTDRFARDLSGSAPAGELSAAGPGSSRTRVLGSRVLGSRRRGSGVLGAWRPGTRPPATNGSSAPEGVAQ